MPGSGPAWPARGETGCVGTRIRLPLRALLPCIAVCLVAAGAAAIGAVCVSAAGGSVLRQADGELRACSSTMLSHSPVAVPGSGAVPGQAPLVPCGIELLSVSGQVLIPAPAGGSGPAIPASGSWLAAHQAGAVTVPGAGSGGRWRVVIKAVHYQAQRMLFVFGPDDLRYLISGPGGRGSSGMLVVMAGLAGTGQAVAGYAAAAAVVLVLLAAATFAVTRAILRPLREAARLVADTGLGASHAGEAAAPGPAADMAGQMAGQLAGQLEQACLQLRRPAAIVHGFTEYCRQQRRSSPAGLDRMLERVTGEITRMETLVEGLRLRSAAEPSRPGSPASDGHAT
jgi:hypothetical protein